MIGLCGLRLRMGTGCGEEITLFPRKTGGWGVGMEE